MSDASGFVCDRCSRCCRHHRVPLTQVDVRRFKDALPDANPEEYLEFLAPHAVDMEGEPESFLLMRDGRRLLALRHVVDEQGSRCVFLGSAGCTVHHARPSACRAYPYDRPDDDRLLGLHPDSLCPEDSGVLITLSGSPQSDPLVATFRAAVVTRDEETSEHARSIAAWNKKQRVRLNLRRTPQSKEEWLASIDDKNVT